MKIPVNYKRTIVVGDIHGCIDEFTELLKKIDFSGKDLLLTVGDIVDRGPGSWEVASFFRKTDNAFSVLGNHDRRLARSIMGKSKPAWSQRVTISQLAGKKELESWASYLIGFPAVIESNHAIITHARLDPNKGIMDQDPYYTCAVGGKSVHIPLQNGIPSWCYEWENNFKNSKPICFGHRSYQKVVLLDKKIYALDTAACKGGYLTAVIFPSCQLLNVKSKKNYYMVTRCNYKLRDNNIKEVKELAVMDLLNLIQSDDIDSGLKGYVESFRKEMQRINLHYVSLKNKIAMYFGKKFRSKAERGKWFSRIKKTFSMDGCAKLLSFLLFKEPENLTEIFSFSSFKNSRYSLAYIDKILAKIDKKIVSYFKSN